MEWILMGVWTCAALLGGVGFLLVVSHRRAVLASDIQMHVFKEMNRQLAEQNLTLTRMRVEENQAKRLAPVARVVENFRARAAAG